MSWSGVAEAIQGVLLKVTVCDADGRLLKKDDVLGGFTVPLEDLKEGPKWHTLEDLPEMATNRSAVRGTLLTGAHEREREILLAVEEE